MSGTIWAQYGKALVFEIYVAKASDGQIAASGDWTIASGDFKVSKDEGAEGNPTTLPAFVASSDKIKVSLSAAELEGKEILLKVKDDATVLGDYWRIKTFGHQSAADPRGVIRRGTAQAGSASTITLDASASSVDDFYNGCKVRAQENAGAGQERQIIDYNGTTKVATIYVAGPPVQGAQWATNPDNTTVFDIVPESIVPAAITVAGGEAAASLSATQTAAIADKILNRNISGGSDTGRTVKQALAAIRNKVTLVGTTLTIYDTDDTTPLWTGTVTLAVRDSLTAVDPA